MDLPSVRDLPEKERSDLLNGPAKLSFFASPVAIRRGID